MQTLCKTLIRGFDSHRRLQANPLSLNSLAKLATASARPSSGVYDTPYNIAASGMLPATFKGDPL